MEVYKDAVQKFVDRASYRIDVFSKTPSGYLARYVLLDVLDVLYRQGVLDESPLAEYSDGLGPMGQDVLYWIALENKLGGSLLPKGERLVSHIKSHEVTTKDLAAYEQLLFNYPYLKFSTEPVEAALTLCRTMSQYSCKALLSSHLKDQRTYEESDLRLILNTLKISDEYPLAISLFRAQQILYRVLTKNSDLNYLVDTLWWYNTRLYLSGMAWKYQQLTGSHEIFVPLLTSLTLDKNHGS